MSKDARLLHQFLKIGSARAGRAPPVLDAPLDTLLPADETDPETRLWLSLGALDLWERSGFQPAPAASPAGPVDAAPARRAPKRCSHCCCAACPRPPCCPNGCNCCAGTVPACRRAACPSCSTWRRANRHCAL